MRTLYAGSFVAVLLATRTAAFAQTEFHLQYGMHKNPFSTSRTATFIVTVQQASEWRYGDSFFFLDYLDDGGNDGFKRQRFLCRVVSDPEFGQAGEQGIARRRHQGFRPDCRVNVGGDANVVKYLPGVRASWSVSRFLFLNTDLTAYIDDNTGVAGGGAPKTGNSFMFDVSWALPFEVGSQSLAVVGHAEYLGGRTNELGEDVKGSILAQPQFVWDLGKAVAGAPRQFMVGIEYQYWRNKLGTDEDESTAQLLLVWRL